MIVNTIVLKGKAYNIVSKLVLEYKANPLSFAVFSIYFHVSFVFRFTTIWVPM